MKICIYGAGAIGGHLAARMYKAGAEVSVIARGAHLAAIQANGLKVHAVDGEHRAPVRASADPAELGQQDAVFVTVKAPALPAVVPVRLNAVLPRFVIAPLPATLVALAKVMPRLLLAALSKPAAPVTVAASAAVKPVKVTPLAVPALAPLSANVLLPVTALLPLPVTAETPVHVPPMPVVAPMPLDSAKVTAPP